MHPESIGQNRHAAIERGDQVRAVFVIEFTTPPALAVGISHSMSKPCLLAAK